jgi:agmatinase
LAVGGDHSISYPLVAAHAQVHEPPSILHLDAHGDLYDSLDGNRYSHACPFARIMEGGHARFLFQAGVRALTDHQREQAGRFGVRVLEMRDTSPESVLKGLAESLPPQSLSGGLYLSLDLDVLDPAFAPGVSHHEPGGLSTRDLITIIQDLPVPLLGADIVELNPLRDPSGITSMAAAKLLKEILAKMLLFEPGPTGG